MGSRPRGRLKRTWLEVVQRDCQVRGLSRDDAMVRGSRRKLIRMVDEQVGCEWINFSSGTGSSTGQTQRPTDRQTDRQMVNGNGL